MKKTRFIAAIMASLWCGMAMYASGIDIDKTSAVSTEHDAWGGSDCSTTFAPAVYTSDGREAKMVETYKSTVENVGTKLSQTIYDLKNGSYTVVLYANAAYTSGRGFESDLTEGAEDVAHVFANESTVPIKATIATTISENGVYTLENVEVTDGTLTLGLATTKAGTNWHTLQIKSLIRHTTTEQICQEAKDELKALIEAATTLSVSEEAIAKAQDVYDNSTDYDAVVAATNELRRAINTAPHLEAGWYLEDGLLTVISDTAWEGDCKWASSKNSIKAVDIMDGVTYIEESAFYNHIYLTSVTIPNSVTSIGASAFTYCEELKHLCFEDGESTLYLGSDERFPIYPFGSTNLETLYIGRNLDYNNWPYNHYYSPFAEKTSLKQITISNRVTSIQSDLFYGCTGIEHIELPNTIKTIYQDAFYGCNLKSVTIPNSVTEIREGAFSANPNLESIIVESGNTKYNSNEDCNAIIETANNRLIFGCKNTTIPANITSIGSSAFSGCIGLTSITFPSNVKEIGSSAFSGCTNLKEVTSHATIAPTLGDNVFDEGTDKVLNIPEGASYKFWAKYFSFPDWEFSQGGNTEWYVDSQGNAYAYYRYDIYDDYWAGTKLYGYGGEKEIKHAYIGEGFTSFGGVGGMNEECLESVTLPSTITEIGSYAFNGCKKLRNIHLHEGITTIGEYAFNDSGIEWLVIPTTVEQIGYNAFGYGYSEEYDKRQTIVFKTFTPPIINSDYMNAYICIPESGNSYPTELFAGSSVFYPRKEYVCEGKKMFVFGSIEEIDWGGAINEYYDYSKDEWVYVTFEDVEEITFTPNPKRYDFIRNMPKLKSVNVQEKADLKEGEYYSIKGSNAIFYYYPAHVNNGQIVLAAGCATTVIPEGTKIISDGAFEGCTGLKEIEIPSSVKYINGSAFQGCTGLTSITIPSNVEWVGGFNGCTGLQSAIIHAQEINSGAFKNCTSLSHVTIGETVNKIAATTQEWYGWGEHAFEGCTALENITVEEGNAVYDSREGCNAIVETTTNKLILASNSTQMPSDITAIAGHAFTTCADLDVTVPATVTSIEEKAFEGTKRVFFESEVPSTITGNIFGWGAAYVPSAAYDTYCNADVWSDYKDRIVTAELANKDITVMSTEGMSGILDAVGLNEADKVVELKVSGEINSYDIIVIRDKMPLLNSLDLSKATVIASSKPFYQTYCTGKNSLSGYAFYDLDKLLSVKLPKDLTTLGDYAFYDCDKLLSVDASATAELDMGSYTFDGCQKLTEFISPERICEVGKHTFKDCSKLEEITLRNISGSIGEEAFKNCGKLKDININSIGGDIQSRAFSQCSGVENITISSIAGNVNDRAFANCPGLKNVEFEQGPARIGSLVFAFSDNLERFVAGEGSTEVASRAFEAIKIIRSWNGFGWQDKEVTIPRTNLKSVTLPQSITSIGNYAFNQCTSLNDFTIPSSVTNIGEGAFYLCKSLERINIPNGVTSISKKAFYECYSLKEVKFPENLTSIGEYAFYRCDFDDLRLPPTLTTIGNYAFGSCNSLSELHIPSAMENIGSNAFAGCNNLNNIYTYTVEPTTITETTFSTFASATLHVPMTSFWNYYWDIGWSRFNHKYFKDFNEKYDYFYLNNDYYLNDSTGYIAGTPDADLRPGAGLIVEGSNENEDPKQSLGDVTIGSDGNGNSASIIGDQNLQIDNLNVKINVKGGRWYFFAFPWDVPMKKISMQGGSDYVFRYYDGEERAKKGNGGWKDVHEPHLKAARGYIFQCSDDDVLVISIEEVKFKKEDKYNELVTHASENLNDASWNLMGNPYLSYYDMTAIEYSAPVTVWDGEKYVAIRPGDDDYQFAPYEAFFVQKPEGEESITFIAEEQMTKTQAETLKLQQAAARRARAINPNRLLINLEFGDEESSDRTRVVFNNSQSHNYETACDAAKFESAGIAQIYTLDNEGVRYAINERPVGNGVVLIGYTAVNNGYYTIEAARMDTKVFIYDAETKTTHNLEDGAYSFYSNKGTFETRFSLGIRSDEATSVENIDMDQAIEATDGGIVFTSNVSATVYNAAGMMVAIQNGAGLIQLPSGTYLVSIGEHNKKIVVK